MNGRPPQSRRSARMGNYAEAKFTNWRPFDAYEGEIATLPEKMRPRSVFLLGNEKRCRIYERPLHPRFLRPFTAEDVHRVLAQVPLPFLQGLHAIYLMGGTEKQETMAFSRLYTYGQYRTSTKSIYLFAFPQKCLSYQTKKHPRPDIAQEYTRAGAKVERSGNKTIFRFDIESLREFYLSDVLVHEIGHHVDFGNLKRKSDFEAERTAEEFVREFIAGRFSQRTFENGIAP
jgi:hypothetical protein